MSVTMRVLAPARRLLLHVAGRISSLAVRGALVAGVACLALLVPEPSRADHEPGHRLDVVSSPDAAPLTPFTGLLERTFPALREARPTWPPFFRDHSLTVHLRSFYFNRQNDTGNDSEAWALGGWVQYTSGWLLDTFAIGGTYYTSLPAYAPENTPGSLLLSPGQDAIGVFGEAWAALRYKQYALLKGGRQKIDEGYVNPQDNRMIPHTFSALLLSGKLDWFRYDVGYVWNMKPRDSNDFISMSRQAGVRDDDKGMILTAFASTPIQDLLLYAANYYVPDSYNTVFGKAEYKFPLGKDLALQIGLQFTDQRDVGDSQLGSFSTWNVGTGARLLWRGLSLGAAMHFTGDDANIRSDYGSWPGYLSLAVTDFDRANEKAFGFGVKYDFGGTLLPFQVPGLTMQILYAHGTDRNDPATGAGLPTTREGNLDIIYNVPEVKGLQLRFRNAYVGRGNSQVVKDFRIIINYEFDFF